MVCFVNFNGLLEKSPDIRQSTVERVRLHFNAIHKSNDDDVDDDFDFEGVSNTKWILCKRRVILNIIVWLVEHKHVCKTN